MMWRHGDVLVASADAVPDEARPLGTSILAHGEVTGHAHRLERAQTGRLWSVGETIFLQVVEKRARLVHEEHAPIELPQGIVRVSD